LSEIPKKNASAEIHSQVVSSTQLISAWWLTPDFPVEAPRAPPDSTQRAPPHRGGLALLGVFGLLCLLGPEFQQPLALVFFPYKPIKKQAAPAR